MSYPEAYRSPLDYLPPNPEILHDDIETFAHWFPIEPENRAFALNFLNRTILLENTTKLINNEDDSLLEQPVFYDKSDESGQDDGDTIERILSASEDQYLIDAARLRPRTSIGQAAKSDVQFLLDRYHSNSPEEIADLLDELCINLHLNDNQ